MEFESHVWILACSGAWNLRMQRELQIKCVKILMLGLERPCNVVT